MERGRSLLSSPRSRRKYSSLQHLRPQVSPRLWKLSLLPSPSTLVKFREAALHSVVADKPPCIDQKASHDEDGPTSDHSASETVGSRLRKRRRTDSAIADEQTSIPKRQKRRRTVPTNTRQHTEPTPTNEDPISLPRDPQNASNGPLMTNGETPSPAVGGLPIQQPSQEFDTTGTQDSTDSEGLVTMTGTMNLNGRNTTQ